MWRLIPLSGADANKVAKRGHRWQDASFLWRGSIIELELEMERKAGLYGVGLRDTGGKRKHMSALSNKISE